MIRDLWGRRNRVAIAAVVMATGAAGGLVASVAAPSTASAAVTNYSCIAGPDGTNQTFTVPANVAAVARDRVRSAGWGRAERTGTPEAPGANGGTATATVSVTPGQVLTVNVGCQGGAGVGEAAGAGGTGGAPNGSGGDASGGPGNVGFTASGGGGGASDVRLAAILSRRSVEAVAAVAVARPAPAWARSGWRGRRRRWLHRWCWWSRIGDIGVHWRRWGHTGVEWHRWRLPASGQQSRDDHRKRSREVPAVPAAPVALSPRAAAAAAVSSVAEVVGGRAILPWPPGPGVAAGPVSSTRPVRTGP